MSRLICVNVNNVTVESEFTSVYPVLQGKKQHTRTSSQKAGGGGFSSTTGNSRLLGLSYAFSVALQLPPVFLENTGIQWAFLWWKNLQKHSDVLLTVYSSVLWFNLRRPDGESNRGYYHYYSLLTCHNERGHDSDSQRRSFVDKGLR